MKFVSLRQRQIAWTMMVGTTAVTLGLVVSPDQAGGSSETGSAPVVVSSSTPEATASGVPVAVQSRKRDASGCLVDAQAIDDIKKRSDELDAHAKELQAREAELKGQSRAVEEEYKKLVELRDEITKMQVALKKENEEKVGKLVETFETMSPKSAAQLIATIDEPLAVSAMLRISTAKLAKIMNLMEPERSARLTEAMAGVVKLHTPTKSNQKGGTGNDGFTPIDERASATSSGKS